MLSYKNRNIKILLKIVSKHVRLLHEYYCPIIEAIWIVKQKQIQEYFFVKPPSPIKNKFNQK